MPEKQADDFAELVGALNQNKVEFVIVGAHAVAFHGYARGTKDLDILIRSSPENIPRVLAALRDFGFGSLGLKEADFAGDNVVELGYPPNRVDLLSGLSGVDTEKVWKTRVKGTYQGHPAYFISRQCLLENKRAAGRGQDSLDVEMLEKQARLTRRKKGRK
ncbi:MAG: hypothetical protein AUJ52_02615 [Elusimicrobia bacterium CG1_02_63_36]|nr:MAG: hypothetical protein AUJ52_02615 [Elusimicrobia bacterium CG1_02_63_36]PIP83502.1 MAG: hypothetical protein COR54_09185 [Elusimicrobia bacterium CG22_combo_CG10-13_8_21_14_all_63_91]PJA17959.1 MAG: hypothetical protein COX66_02785 [Elusimicrobia bacterium CG_4_10_14_0_2_um_filter_63_34]PJB24204.1 MAG: hypothetical protein CO113_15110 [Elusimicrobia bacterium CG_4_9_14_3_um_filter_62_55]